MSWIAWWLITGFLGFYVDWIVDRLCDPEGDRERLAEAVRRGMAAGIPQWVAWILAISVSTVCGPPGLFWALVIAPRVLLKRSREEAATARLALAHAERYLEDVGEKSPRPVEPVPVKAPTSWEVISR